MNFCLKGERINLRILRLSDAFSIYQNAKDKDICQYTLLPYPYKLKNAKEFIKRTQKRFHKKTDYELGIENKENKKIIGMMSLMSIKDGRAEVGYWLGKKYWGQGLAKEALLLILNFGFKKLKLRRIHAKVCHPNQASYKLLESVGFKYEGRLRQHMRRFGKILDELCYGILKTEFK